MNVIHFPKFRHNPYHELLAKSLEPHGWKSCNVSLKNPFLALWQLLTVPASIIHVHTIGILLVPRKYGGVVTSFFAAVVFFTIVRVRMLFGAHVVYTVHNLEPHQKYPKKLFLYINNYLFKISSEVIVHYPAGKEKLCAVYPVNPQKVHVVIHGNYVDSYPNTLSKNEARDRLHIPENANVFLCFGNIRTYKGINDLIESFNALNTPDTYLVIAGHTFDTNHIEAIKASIAHNPHIIFHPIVVDAKDVQVYMNAADCVVMPYKKIFTSGALYLAASFKKPFVASDLLPFQSSPFKGFLYDHTNNDGLKNAMHDVIQNKEKLVGYGQYNYTVVTTAYSWEQTGKATADIYNSCLTTNNKKFSTS